MNNATNGKQSYQYIRYERRVCKDSSNFLSKCEDESLRPSNFIRCKFQITPTFSHWLPRILTYTKPILKQQTPNSSKNKSISLNVLIINRAINICSSNADFMTTFQASLCTRLNINGGIHKSSNLTLICIQIRIMSLAAIIRKSISKLQIQVATYVFELSAGNCHR